MKPYGPLFVRAIFVFATMFLFSCSRPSSDQATVTFNLPATYWINQGNWQQNQSNYVSNILRIAKNSAQINSSTSNLNSLVSSGIWGSIIPTGYQTGPYDNNCLFIVATGPELDRFACYKNDIGTPVFKVGEISNPKFVGSEITLNVTPGSGRVFLLLGMHAKSVDECLAFSDPAFNRSRLSRPYIIGKTDAVTVEAGADNKFLLQAIQGIQQNEYIDYCDAPDLAGIYSPPTNLTVGRIDLSFDKELTKNAAYQNQCLPISIKLKDSSGLVDLQSLYTDNLSLETESNTALSIYNNVQDCLNLTNIQTEFSTYKKYETTVWLNASLTTLSNQSVRLRGMVGNSITLNKLVGTAVTSETVTVKATERASMVSTSAAKLAVTKAPEYIQNDTCYQATMSANNLEFNTAGFIGGSQTTTMSYIDASTSGALTFYIDNDCTLGAANSITYGPYVQNHNFVTAWFKASGYSAGETLTLTHSYSENPAVVKTTLTVVAGNSAEPALLKLSGPNVLTNPAANSCYGPYRVELLSSGGVSVLAPFDSQTNRRKEYNIRINFDNNSTTKLYARGGSGTTDLACSGAEIINGDQVLISDLQGYYEFYVRVQSFTTDAASLNRYIGVTDISPIANGTPLGSTTQLLQIFANGGTYNNDTIPPPPVCNGDRYEPTNCFIP